MRPGRASGSHASHQQGFTLHELLVTLAIVGGLTSAAAALGSIVQDHRIVAEVNTFVAELSLARSEAIKRGQRLTFCPSADAKTCKPATDFAWWHEGAMLFADKNANGHIDDGDQIIRVHSPQNGVRVKSSAARRKVVFQATGMAGASNLTFTVCSGADGAQPRYVIVSNTGRARVASMPPDGRADEPSELCS